MRKGGVSPGSDARQVSPTTSLAGSDGPDDDRVLVVENDAGYGYQLVAGGEDEGEGGEDSRAFTYASLLLS